MATQFHQKIIWNFGAYCQINSVSHPVDEHGEALGGDVGRDELGGGEPHAEALDERHHPAVAPAPPHEVHLPAEPERPISALAPAPALQDAQSPS